VGLSTGITPKLSTGSKLLLILLMFWGRVGLIIFFYGIARKEEKGRVTYADVNVPIG